MACLIDTGPTKEARMARPARTDLPMPDVVDLLVGQHAIIRGMFREVATSTGGRRTEAVARLLRMIVVHETAEQEVVHPLARRVLPDPVVDDRLREEHDAHDLLSRLDGMDLHDPRFAALFDALRQAVLTHARHEERYEFNWLRQRCAPEQLRKAAAAVRAAERFAPTHPLAEPMPVTGPATAVVDRIRTAIGQVS